MKLLSLFTGIGAFEKSLDRLQIPYELVGYCEIDKYASKSYSAIHNVPESMNLGDITKIDEKALPKDIDLITYGFPCQDISLAGKQKGILDDDVIQLLRDIEFVDSEIIDLAKWIGKGEYTDEEVRNHLFHEYGLSGYECDVLIENGINGSTRSGLFFQALRIIEETQPKVAIAENVKNLVGKKFKEQFDIVLDSLEQAGYNNYWQVLNAKDYGIPQNRERVFIVSIRKDIDNGTFTFPEGFPLELRLKDMLEDVVDEKYYLSEKAIAGFNEHLKRNLEKGNGFGWHPTDGNVIANTLLASGATRPSDNFIEEPILIGGMQKNQAVKTDGICTTLTSSMGTGGGYVPMVTEPIIRQIANVHPTKTRENPNQGRVYDPDYIAPSLNTCGGGNREPYIVTSVPLKRGYSVEIKEETEDVPPEIDVIGNYSKSAYMATSIVNKNGIAPTVRENHGQVTAIAISEANKTGYKMAYEGDGVNISSRMKYQRGNVQKDSCQTLTTSGGNDRGVVVSDIQGLRIRKLTPKEFFRLMGFDDADFEKAEKVNSNTQLYKQAGNSIVVDVLEYLIKALVDSGALETRKEKEMELRVNEVQLPEAIDFNYEELKQELTGKVSHYETVVYTDEQIIEAKKDKANLNKLKKAMNDERIRLQKEYMQPFNDFKDKIDELIKIIDKPVEVIDRQVKAYEEKEKQDKLEAIKEYFNNFPAIEGFETLSFEQIFNEKWLNKSESMKSIQEAISNKCSQIMTDIETLSNLPEFGFEATEVYKTTLDINKAINEAKRMSEIAKARAEHEAKIKAQEEEQARLAAEAQATTPVNTPSIEPSAPVEEEPVRQWVSFKAYLSMDDAKALGEFMRNRNITFEQI